jgi:hypothetical protein
MLADRKNSHTRPRLGLGKIAQAEIALSLCAFFG